MTGEGANNDEIDYTSSGSAGESCLLAETQDDEEERVDELTFLCELVGARDLSIHDVQEAGDLDTDKLRPFCVVKFGDRTVHKSKVAEETGPNPIWTLSTNSLFLLRAKPEEMSDSTLTIEIHSKRESTISSRLKLNSNHFFLGQVSIDATKILERCDQQRFELTIEDEIGEESTYLGKLALRFQVATKSDQDIVALFNQQKNRSKKHSRRELAAKMKESSGYSNLEKPESRQQARLCTEVDETEVAQDSFLNAVTSVFSSRTVTDATTGDKKVRVKPYPDPTREEETKFMSPHDIHVETRLPSHKWVEAGSGTLGSLYCEVLSCHDLPNVDVGEMMGNVTDSFVCLVYEDTCAQTECIDDELSPHWLPWTQRAFKFGMMHPASILYIGVFDYDLGTSHEPLGRVAVNVSNLQRNTVHTLKYNLYPSSNVTDRTAVGSITIRLRIDCSDEKTALMAALKPRPKIFVNVKKPKSFAVVRYTCFGEYDGEEKFDMTVTRSYINEIFEYKAAFSYALHDTFTSLVFWRGQVEIFSIMVPLYSFFFFCMAADFIERPYMFVPYTCFSIAGMMLGTLTIRRQHPSPWNSCPSFWHYLHILWTGKAPTPVSSIKEYEGHEAALAYEKAWRDRLENDRILAEKRLKLQQELNEIGDDNIQTRTSPSAIPMDILARLTRYQGMAGRYCGYLRFVKVIVSWEESIVSFWITAVFLAIGFVSMLLPWRFLLTWIGRLGVWGFLGPHMKVVDLYMRANRKKDGLLNEFVGKFDVARLRREDALKQKDVKAIAFGEYSTNVPSFNIARHFDRPLPESSARLCRQTSKSGANRRVSVASLKKHEMPWIPGQQLFGEMIPRPEQDSELHEIDLLRQREKLDRFRAAVKESVARNGIEATRERLALNKLGFDSQVPLSVGYEVIPEGFSPPSDGNGEYTYARSEKQRISVVLTSSDKKLSGCVHDTELLLENDGKYVYEVKPDDASYKSEEGTEIIERRCNGSSSREDSEVCCKEQTDCGDSLLDLMFREPSWASSTDDVYYPPMENEEESNHESSCEFSSSTTEASFGTGVQEEDNSAAQEELTHTP